MMLKHLTERQKHNLIKYFERKSERTADKREEKKLCGAQLCAHVKQIHTIAHNAYTRSLAHFHAQWAAAAAAV